MLSAAILAATRALEIVSLLTLAIDKDFLCERLGIEMDRPDTNTQFLGVASLVRAGEGKGIANFENKSYDGSKAYLATKPCIAIKYGIWLSVSIDTA
jgi:hypothetical protein